MPSNQMPIGSVDITGTAETALVGADASLNAIETSTSSIDAKTPALVGGLVPVTATVTSTTLPAGAATEATSASIDGKVPSLEDGRVPVAAGPTPYDSSLFGGFRAHHDLAIFERLHDYPGASTAYDPDTYGYDVDAGPVGSIAHVADQGALKLSVNAGTVGGKSRLRSHDIMRYQPGCSPCVQLTGYASTNGTSLKVMRRSSATGSPVDTELATIAGYDASKANRYEIRFAYLGVQGAQFYVNGTLVHAFTAAGSLSLPYMKTANLPLSVELRNVGVAEQVVDLGLLDDDDGLFFRWTWTAPAALDWTYKCASVRLIGGNGYTHKSFVYSRATTGVGATLIPLFSMRVKSTLYGIASKVQAFPVNIDFFAETNAGALELVWNPQTLTGATWAATSPSGAIDIDTAASAITIGTGLSLFRSGQGQNTIWDYDLREIFHILDRKLRRQAYTGAADVLSVCVQREGAANFDPRVTMTWMELR